MTDLEVFQNGMTAEEALLLHQKLWSLLEKLAKEYTFGESTSVSSEDAQRLLASAVFVLKQHLSAEGKEPKSLIDDDIFTAFEHGKKLVLKSCDEVRGLWKSACSTVPKAPSLALTETLKSINEGFYHYNIDLFSAELPCSISYPLAEPVPENLLGTEYLAEYLRRVILENYVISKFEAKKLRMLLFRISPYYSELLINLCEPSLQNCVGLSVLGEDIFGLSLSAEMRHSLSDIFSSADDEHALFLLENAAENICCALELSDEFSCGYIRRFVLNLLPRIKASAKNGLRGVFI